LLRVRFVLLACLVCPIETIAQNPRFTNRPSNYISFEVPGATSTIARGINDLAEVTGYYWNGYSPLGGFIRYPNGQFTKFEFPGGGETAPIGINNDGDVIGTWTPGASYGPGFQGFVRSHWGVFSSIEVQGSTAVWPVQINNEGTAVGYYSTASD
jgi:hypothetical protein